MATIGERLARVEAILERIEERMDKFSDQGRTPAPKSGAFHLPTPATIAEYAKAIALLIPVLGAIYGVSYSGAQSGGSAAVTDAVEQGEAVPLAAPVLRVLPVPQVVPVPMPTPEPPPEPHLDAVVRPDDLMPLP